MRRLRVVLGFHGFVFLNAFDVSARKPEFRFDPAQPVIDAGPTVQFERNGLLDDGRSETATLRRFDGWAARLFPLYGQIVRFVDGKIDVKRASTVAQCAIFRRVRHHFVNDKREHRVGFRRDVDGGAAYDRPFAPVPDIGVELRFQQFAERCRRPVVLGDVVMCAGERTDAARNDLGEDIDILRFGARLVDQALDQVEDVANAVIKLRDQQLLLLLRLGAGTHGVVRQAKNHLDQTDAQRFGQLKLHVRPGRAAPHDHLFPRFEALARVQPLPVRAVLDGLRRVSAPANSLRLFLAPQHEIVARAARNRNDQRTDGTIGEPFRLGNERGERGRAEDAAGRGAVELRQDAPELFLVRRRAISLVNIVRENAGTVETEQVLDRRHDGRQALAER